MSLQDDTGSGTALDTLLLKLPRCQVNNANGGGTDPWHVACQGANVPGKAPVSA